MPKPIVQAFTLQQAERWRNPKNKTDKDFRSRWIRKARLTAEREDCTFQIVDPDGAILHEDDPPDPWHGRH